jgi:PhnB protein
MQLNPYLLFNGQCEEAFQFYQKCLGGKIVAMISHVGTPAEQHVPAAWRNKIMHARLETPGGTLMGSDNPQYEAPRGFSASLEIKDPKEAESVYTALSEGGKVKMPLQETFWAVRFSMFTDRYGIPWMINCPMPS